MKFLLLLSAVALASSATVPNDSVSEMVLNTFMDCFKSDVTLCLKEKALKATENLRATRQIDIFEGMSLVNHAPLRESKSLELSTDTELRKQQVSERLWESASDLVKNSELELSWSGDEEEEEESRSVGEESRGKKKKIKKKLKLLLPLLLIAKAKAGAIAVAALVVIAISIAKIALIAKLSFIAKIIAIIKYLLHKKHAKEEIIIPYHHEEHPHGWDEGGWNQGGWDQGGGGWEKRSEANKMAYSAYPGQ